MSKRKLQYELIEAATGRVIREFTNKTIGLQYACAYVREWPEELHDVIFVVFEPNGKTRARKIVLSLTGEELRQVCEDEGIEVEDDLGYTEA